MFTQWILSDRLLLIVTNRQKSNFNGGFKLELVIIYYLDFIVKILWI